MVIRTEIATEVLWIKTKLVINSLLGSNRHVTRFKKSKRLFIGNSEINWRLRGCWYLGPRYGKATNHKRYGTVRVHGTYSAGMQRLYISSHYSVCLTVTVKYGVIHNFLRLNCESKLKIFLLLLTLFTDCR